MANSNDSLSGGRGFRSRSRSGEAPNRQPRYRRKPAAEKPAGGAGKAPAGGAAAKRGVPRLRYDGVDKPRQVAYETLLRVTLEDAYANLTLPKTLRDRRITGRDAAFATEITYGTLRSQGVLDAVIAECSSRALGQIAPEVLAALRLGAYELLYTRVGDHAAVDTSVRLVEAAGQVKAKGFVNGVLRTIARTPAATWFKRLTPTDPLAAAAFESNHPEWIARSFATALGERSEELAAALAADSERPRVHLAARPGEITGEELALITGGEPGRYSPYAVYLDGGDPHELEPVRQHLAAVQDEGSQLIARALTIAPIEGEDAGRWLDLCAGPGGKAAMLGALAAIDGATVDAVEVAEHRARLVEAATEGLPVRVHVADGRDPGLEPGFDRVLVDAPCSGLGALRRRPEARWRKQESDIPELAALQFALLSSALKLVRPGGVVIYSTCSPDLRETRGAVDRAVRELGAVELDSAGLVAPMTDTGAGPSVQMWPHRHGTDAMFIAALRRA